MEKRGHQALVYAVIVTAALGIQTPGSSLAAQSSASKDTQAAARKDLQGTMWLCTMQVGDGKTRKGYMYLSPSMGVKLAETERSPKTLEGDWWPKVEDVPKDLEEIEPNLRWE